MSKNLKYNELQDDLFELAKSLGITIRKDNGNFRGGLCKLNDKQFIIINKSIPKDSVPNLIAQCICKSDLDKIYIKPNLRDFIEKNTILNFEEIELKIDIQNEKIS